MSSHISDFGFWILDWKRWRQNPQSAIRNSQSHGFTLIEVLLAMAILSVVMTVIYASFSTAGQNVEQAEMRRHEVDIARTLMSRLSADISNAYIKNTNVHFMEGRKEELDGENGEKIRHDAIFLTTLTNWRKRHSKEMELWEVGYFFKEKLEGTGYSLFRREKRELSKDASALDDGVEYEITDRVRSLRFSYSDNGSTWTDDGWQRSLNRIPKTVEIALILDTGRVYTTKVDLGNRQ